MMEQTTKMEMKSTPHGGVGVKEFINDVSGNITDEVPALNAKKRKRDTDTGELTEVYYDSDEDKSYTVPTKKLNSKIQSSSLLTTTTTTTTTTNNDYIPREWEKKFSNIPFIYCIEEGSVAENIVKNLKLECAICYELAKDTTAHKCSVNTCGTIICMGCSKTLKQSNKLKTCTVCNNGDISTPISIERELLCLPRKCPACDIALPHQEALIRHLSGTSNSVDKEKCKLAKICSGCDWLVPLSGHECGEDMVSCPNPDCERVNIRRNQLKDHRSQCPFEIIQCAGGGKCGTMLYRHSRNEHESTCIHARFKYLELLNIKLKAQVDSFSKCKLFFAPKITTTIPLRPKLEYQSMIDIFTGNKYTSNTSVSRSGSFLGEIGYSDGRTVSIKLKLKDYTSGDPVIFYLKNNTIDILVDKKDKRVIISDTTFQYRNVEIIIDRKQNFEVKKKGYSIILECPYNSIDAGVICWDNKLDQFIPTVGFTGLTNSSLSITKMHVDINFETIKYRDSFYVHLSDNI